VEKETLRHTSRAGQTSATHRRIFSPTVHPRISTCRKKGWARLVGGLHNQLDESAPKDWSVMKDPGGFYGNNGRN